MNIGQASKNTGVSTKMIRYYETVGLIRPADRTGSNYRSFSDRDINDLRFIRRSRTLGFSMDEITRLLSLWRDRERPSREVKAIAERHVAELDAKVTEMKAMADTLRLLARCCAGDDRPDCPILADLSTPKPAVPVSDRKVGLRERRRLSTQGSVSGAGSGESSPRGG